VSGARYLVTGGAGFIGSHIVERLLHDVAGRGGVVRVLDDFSTGRMANLRGFDGSGLEIMRGDIRDLATVERAARGVSVIFHQAAMRSVPQSIADPMSTHAVNVTGTLNIFEAARRVGVRRVVYASSSSVYGERPMLPKREDQPVEPISPYGVSKAAGEHYGSVWHRIYGVQTVGLRYFNVFGERQDAASTYAAVIPNFIFAALAGSAVEVHGDGNQSRDFTHVDNVVDANLLAATASGAGGHVFNVGCGARVSLLDMLDRLEAIVGHPIERRHTPARQGDVPHSLADISKAGRLLAYSPRVGFDEGLARAVAYFDSLRAVPTAA
jgi:UDP-N-acetylglucosamine/UDP-N-acetyl-alpha-D-glucosaminouronate 4-epimerase